MIDLETRAIGGAFHRQRQNCELSPKQEDAGDVGLLVSTTFGPAAT